MKTFLTLVLICLCCLGAGCASGRGQALDPQAVDDTEDYKAEDYIAESYCSPAVNPEAPGGKSVSGQPAAPLPQETAEGLSFLSPAARQMAEVIRVEDLVGQILVLEREPSQNVEGARLRLLEMRQELSDRLLLALFDASSVAAELECEKGRAEAIASGLDEIQNDIQQRRTVIALLADSVAGLISGVFLFGGSEVLAGGVDVIGNILQGSFGYAALGGQQEHQVKQSRNLLQEVWEGPQESDMFPESVWRFLTWPQENTRLRSRREAIIQDWKKHLGKKNSGQEDRRKELYFGEGGTYSIPELRHRAEMLDRLKASVRLMSQDLNLLFKETLGHLSGMARTASSRASLID